MLVAQKFLAARGNDMHQNRDLIWVARNPFQRDAL
jgi:hypothetical protein